MMRNRLVGALVSALALVSGLASGCAWDSESGPERAGVMLFAVGDCVDVPAPTPAEPKVARATRVDCGADPSYTVGAMADGSGACPSAEYQHLSARLSDPSTARLCLVPNLVADHCYELGLPAGVMHLADCAERAQQGVLVQVTQRLDVRDQSACPAASGQFAWPYPAPARTYCTRTVY